MPYCGDRQNDKCTTNARADVATPGIECNKTGKDESFIPIRSRESGENEG